MFMKSCNYVAIRLTYARRHSLMLSIFPSYNPPPHDLLDEFPFPFSLVTLIFFRKYILTRSIIEPQNSEEKNKTSFL